MGSMVGSGSLCPCVGCCEEDSAIKPGAVNRRQLCQAYPWNIVCCRSNSHAFSKCSAAVVIPASPLANVAGITAMESLRLWASHRQAC